MPTERKRGNMTKIGRLIMLLSKTTKNSSDYTLSLKTLGMLKKTKELRTKEMELPEEEVYQPLQKESLILFLRIKLLILILLIKRLGELPLPVLKLCHRNQEFPPNHQCMKVSNLMTSRTSKVMDTSLQVSFPSEPPNTDLSKLSVLLDKISHH